VEQSLFGPVEKLPGTDMAENGPCASLHPPQPGSEKQWVLFWVGSLQIVTCKFSSPQRIVGEVRTTIG
jgi:hypothetical protein